MLLLVVEVVLDWRLRKGREGRRKVGKGDEGEGMLIGGMFVLLLWMVRCYGMFMVWLSCEKKSEWCYLAGILSCDCQGGGHRIAWHDMDDMTWIGT